MKSLTTVLQSILVSFCVCAGGAFVLGFLIYFWAQYKAEGMRPDQAASYLCGAGMAPIGLALLGAVIGPVIGAVVGVTFAILGKVETPPVQLRSEK